MDTKRIVVMGFGEVGKAVAQMYVGPYDVQILDLNPAFPTWPEEMKVDVLNVCIPYNESFVELVRAVVGMCEPDVTIIHSTVAPGTTERLVEYCEGRSEVVHSPVRGVHPNLLEGLKTFDKYIGGDTIKGIELASAHLSALGYKIRPFSSSRLTEIGKLLSTSYYGVLIAWHGEMQKICDELGVPFELAATDFTKSYNEGYTELDMEHVVRPAFYPPENDLIGGHCILPNAKLLKEALDGAHDEALDLILKYGKKEED